MLYPINSVKKTTIGIKFFAISLIIENLRLSKNLSTVVQYISYYTNFI